MKTPTFALILGIVYLLLGLMGLIPLFLVPPPIDAPPTHFTLLYGYLLGLFPVNLLHSVRSEEHTSELQSHSDVVCRLLLEKKNVWNEERRLIAPPAEPAVPSRLRE